MSRKQIKLLEEYELAFDTARNIIEKQAFAKGIKFTIRLFLEAICED